MLTYEARAKINWTLDITGVRPDGYHEMDMLLSSVALHDTLSVEEAESGVTLALAQDARVPAGGDNLALRAAQQLLACTGAKRGARMTLEKRVPVGAGMGGGSADAAAALVGLNRLWGLGLSEDELCQIGFTLGADVPFCVKGGLARVRGAGEALLPCACGRAFFLVVIQPCRGLSTRDVFAAYDQMSGAPRRPDNDRAMRALAAGSPRELAEAMGNVLQPAAFRMRPGIEAARAALLQRGAFAAMMTGSGSAVFGAFDRLTRAEHAYRALSLIYRTCHITYTVAQGVAPVDEMGN